MKILNNSENVLALYDDITEILVTIIPRIVAARGLEIPPNNNFMFHDFGPDYLEFSYYNYYNEEDWITVPINWVINPDLIEPTVAHELEIQHTIELERQAINLESQRKKELRQLLYLKDKYEGDLPK